MSQQKCLFLWPVATYGCEIWVINKTDEQRIQAFEMKASKFIRQNNIMTILIKDVNNTMAGYQKEIFPSSWSPIVKYSVYNINSEV